MVLWKHVPSGPDGRPPPAAFNMVEVALALAVIGIGLVSILAFFPIGLSAARDAAADSYIADSADHLLHWQAAILKSDSSRWPSGTSGKPGSSESFSGSGQAFGSATIILDGSSPDQLFKLTQGTDFSAVYRIWLDTVTFDTYDPVAGTTVSVPVGIDTACAINMEVSWPAEAPYAKRQRTYYHLDVFRPQ